MFFFIYILFVLNVQYYDLLGKWKKFPYETNLCSQTGKLQSELFTAISADRPCTAWSLACQMDQLGYFIALFVSVRIGGQRNISNK